MPDAGRLALAQERNEQLMQAEAALKASEARKELRQLVVDYFCKARGHTSADPSTISTLLSYVNEHGADLVFQWIDIAAQRLPTKRDGELGKYISGIRRCVMKEQSNA